HLDLHLGDADQAGVVLRRGGDGVDAGGEDGRAEARARADLAVAARVPREGRGDVAVDRIGGASAEGDRLAEDVEAGGRRGDGDHRRRVHLDVDVDAGTGGEARAVGHARRDDVRALAQV